jgi:hypothetical protein
VAGGRARVMPGLRSRQAPGVVSVRLSGEQVDLDALAGILRGHPAVEVITASGPRQNRYDPGQRVYLTVRVRR